MSRKQKIKDAKDLDSFLAEIHDEISKNPNAKITVKVGRPGPVNLAIHFLVSTVLCTLLMLGLRWCLSFVFGNQILSPWFLLAVVPLVIVECHQQWQKDDVWDHLTIVEKIGLTTFMLGATVGFIALAFAWLGG